MLLEEIENRFKKSTGLDVSIDLTEFPLKEGSGKFDKNKARSDSHGEVFTPLWLVDQMILKNNSDKPFPLILDACAGHGQFSIRWLRYRANKLEAAFNMEEELARVTMCEIQFRSCVKLLYTFGKDINLLVGPAESIATHNGEAGIYVFKTDKWNNVTAPVKKICSKLFSGNSSKDANLKLTDILSSLLKFEI